MTQAGVPRGRAEEAIQSRNFGGLNTVANNLNVPYEDSTEILNMEVTLSGDLRKREGTRVLYEDSNQAKGVNIIPFTTGLEYNFVVTKEGTGLKVYEILNNAATAVITKSNVFSSNAETVRPNYAKTAEPEPRIIITTGFNQPVQLKFVEQQGVATGTAGSYVLTNAERYVNATTSNILVFKNRVRQTGWGVSYSAGSLTISSLSVVSGDVIDVILVVWQRYAEALRFLGNRFTSNTTRFHVVKTDQNVEMPLTIRDDIVPLSFYGSSTQSNYFQVRAHASTAWGDAYTFVNTKRPSNTTEYCHGDGGRYQYDAGDADKIVNAAGLFVTFGDIIASSDPTTLVLSRMRRLSGLNGGIGISGDDLDVYVDSALVPQHISLVAGNATFGAYYLLDAEGDARNTTTAATGYFIEFDAGEQIGVPSTSEIEIINTTTNFIGSAATTSRDQYDDGSYFPIYGLGVYADYNQGSFPRNVALYQGRMVFGGFINRPLDVIFSNNLDSVTAGVNYNSFQFDAFTGLDTDPFSITLASAPDDRVVGMTGWQESLFVFSRRSVFRVSGGNTINVTPSNKVTIILSNLGLVNSYAFDKSEKTIYYLSDTGVYDLNPELQSGEYVSQEQSIKISNQFGITLDTLYRDLAWLTFDPTKRLLFLGMPIINSTFTSDRLYVFNTIRASWSRWETGGGFQVYNCSDFVDRQLGIGFLAACCSQRDSSGVPANFMFLRFHSNVEKYTDEVGFLDYQRKVTATGGAQTIVVEPAWSVQYTTTDKAQIYSIRREDISGQFHTGGFTPVDVQEINDLTVQLETSAGSGVFNTLVNGTDYVKLTNGRIYLRENPGTGRLLNFLLELPVLNSPQGLESYSSPGIPVVDKMLYADRLRTVYGTDWTYVGAVGDSDWDISVVSGKVATDAVLISGQAYPCLYKSPTFTRESLAQLKRNKYLYLYFNNEYGLDTWEVSHVNGTSGQTAEALVGQPKHRLNATALLRYEDDLSADISWDIYGFSELMFDEGRFDIDPSNAQYRTNAMFKIHLLGVSATYQVIIYSYDDSAMILSAYQVTNNIRGMRGITWG